MTENKNVLIVGAGGFIGGFIANESLRRGFNTWCALRQSTSRRFLTDPALNFVVLDYESPQAIANQLSTIGLRWDWIIYNLGATKVTNYLDFNRINCDYLRNFLQALQIANLMPERFIYMSSLSALGPADEQNYTPYTDAMIPFPNTRYGVSKLKAETIIESTPGLNWIILRPTGVYGPHDHDYRMMVQCIDRHLDFGIGFRRQMLTFIYVEDLARAIFDALANSQPQKKYLISEDRSYTSAQVTKIIAAALGRKFVMPVKLPIALAKIVCTVAEKLGQWTMKPSTLNSDKFRIMAQRNWNVNIEPARKGFGFNPQVSLAEGMKHTVADYRIWKQQNKHQ
ncbi:MAG: NAD(P)-dependent oxidoreductase [Muribaculum sp.]|nr:NAD(P)-dependent oxidoreductase [Muribaculaceae bacterium]MCM1080782.1 NAD(P)-dependent oxidoreductase [Muribaculum sp.]